MNSSPIHPRRKQHYPSIIYGKLTELAQEMPLFENKETKKMYRPATALAKVHPNPTEMLQDTIQLTISTLESSLNEEISRANERRKRMW